LGYTTTATAAGTTTLTAASNHQQFFTGTLAQTIVLPVTSTLALGMGYSIENNSTGTLTVQSSGLNTISTIPAGVTTQFTCILITGTTAASWDYDHIAFAAITGTGSAVLGTAPTIGTPTLGSSSTDTVLITGAPSIGGAGLGMGMGFRNRILNGSMVIDQKNAGASVTPVDGTYSVDRWVCGLSQASKFTVQQTPSATETGFAVRVAAGFTNYLACTTAASANVTLGASDVFVIGQKIEGFNFADMAWGTAAAKTVTLSFLAYSSVTGTFGGAFVNNASNRSYPFTYSIPTANTWTTISVTIAGDTTGTWVGATNGVAVKIWFSLGSGSSGLNTAGAWVGANSYSATGAVSPITTNSSTFYITGVQLEKGSTATSFDYRPYGTELALCQRYYYKVTTYPLGFAISASDLYCNTLKLPVTMRSAPSGDAGATYQVSTGSAGTVNIVNTTGSATTVDAVSLSNTGTGWTTNTRVGITLGLTSEL
jgi:hypothetical protein